MELKRLYRSRKEKMIAGVSGGLAEYFNIDVVIIRLAWVLLALAGGPGLIGYIIAWIVIPTEPNETGGDSSNPDPTEEADPASRENTRKAMGYLLLAIGLFFLVRNLFPAFRWNMTWGLHMGRWWPALIILAGLGILFGFFNRGRSE